MGGYGSGRWRYYENKRQVEECWVLDASELPLDDLERSPVVGTLRVGERRKGLIIHYTLGFLGQAGLVLELSYSLGKGPTERAVKERITLQSTRPNFGGVRWWLSCPLSRDGERCNQRVSKLYLPPGEKRFGCRRCHDLTYRSCQESHRYGGLFDLSDGVISEAMLQPMLWTDYPSLDETHAPAERRSGGLLDVFDKVLENDHKRMRG